MLDRSNRRAHAFARLLVFPDVDPDSVATTVLPASVLAAVDLLPPPPPPSQHRRRRGRDELETVDDGSGQAVAGAGEDVSERKALWSQLRA